MAKDKTVSSKRNGAAHSLTVSVEEDLHAYRQMLLIRRFEEKAGQLYALGHIGGFCHLYIGQEAVVVGMALARKSGDQLITAYRDHAHMLSCGMDPKRVMAELTGRRSGYSKGKGGSMHMFSVENCFYGGHGVDGVQVPLGTGLAFANRYRGNSAVTFCYLGDGAVSQGQVYESFHMAKLWSLPVVFVIENNKCAEGASLDRTPSNEDLSQRGLSLGIPGEQVDGTDIRTVKAAGDKAGEWARSGRGPYILEMLTSRFRGHSMSYPTCRLDQSGAYEAQRHRDPIERVRVRLQHSEGVSRKDLKEINNEVIQTMSDAVAFAREAAEPSPFELMTDVYVEA